MIRRTLLKLSFILILLFICNCKKEAENVAISSDGVKIRFDLQGEGDPVLVFVHGWCCDRNYWDAQVSHFAKKYKVVTIDLAGHGESGLNRSSYTIKAFGDDVVAVVNKLDLNRLVLIGHSLGGLVILEAAQQFPDRAMGLVVVDEIFNVEMQIPQEEIEEMFAPFHANFSEATANYVRQNMFTANSDADLVNKIASDMSKALPEIGLSSMEIKGGYMDFFNNSKLQMLQDIKPPIVFINSESNPTAIEINKRYIPSLKMKIMSGVGHFVMIEDPETFNRLLEESIKEFNGL